MNYNYPLIVILSKNVMTVCQASSLPPHFAFESRLWSACSPTGTFFRTAHSFACSELHAALICSLARVITCFRARVKKFDASDMFDPLCSGDPEVI